MEFWVSRSSFSPTSYSIINQETQLELNLKFRPYGKFFKENIIHKRTTEGSAIKLEPRWKPKEELRNKIRKSPNQRTRGTRKIKLRSEISETKELQNVSDTQMKTTRWKLEECNTKTWKSLRELSIDVRKALVKYPDENSKNGPRKCKELTKKRELSKELLNPQWKLKEQNI